MSRRLWGGGNTSPLKTTAWEARSVVVEFGFETRSLAGNLYF